MQRAGPEPWAKGGVRAHECEAGEEGGFLVSPDVTEPRLLVASVRAGLWAQRAVKLKAAAQSGLLPGVCIQPELFPHQERESLRGTLAESRTKGPQGSALQSSGEVAARPLGCLLSGKSEIWQTAFTVKKLEPESFRC